MYMQSLHGDSLNQYSVPRFSNDVGLTIMHTISTTGPSRNEAMLETYRSR